MTNNREYFGLLRFIWRALNRFSILLMQIHKWYFIEYKSIHKHLKLLEDSSSVLYIYIHWATSEKWFSHSVLMMTCTKEFTCLLSDITEDVWGLELTHLLSCPAVNHGHRKAPHFYCTAILMLRRKDYVKSLLLITKMWTICYIPNQNSLCRQYSQYSVMKGINVFGIRNFSIRKLWVSATAADELIYKIHLLH